MYNLRYHVASLVAVFLFLSVGLMLGTIVAERGVLDTQRDTLVSSLRGQYEDLSTENRELEAIGDARGEFIDDTIALLLEDRLMGKTVVILSNDERADGLTSVNDAVLRAGGVPVSVPVMISGLGLDDPAISVEASALATAALGTEQLMGELEVAVVQILAEEWSSPSMYRPMTEALGAAGVLDVTGLANGVAADGVVVLTTWEGVPDKTVIELGRELDELGVSVVAVEVSTQPTGLAAAAVERGLSAVEEPGTPESEFALVMVLGGRASGYFGPGEGTEARYPIVIQDE